MVNRATLFAGIKHESEGISFYSDLLKIIDVEDKYLIKQILFEKKKHKEILEMILKKHVIKKGQQKITNLLSME